MKKDPPAPETAVSHRTSVACSMTLSTVLQRKAYQAASRQQAAQTQWLMGLAVDAMELTRIRSFAIAQNSAPLPQKNDGPEDVEYATGLGVPQKSDQELGLKHHVLPESRLNNLRATAQAERPALKVPKSKRAQYTAALGAAEWLSSAATGTHVRAGKEDCHRIRAFLATLGEDRSLIPEDCMEELRRLLQRAPSSKGERQRTAPAELPTG